jgi:CTD kinase subunit alpha
VFPPRGGIGIDRGHVEHHRGSPESSRSQFDANGEATNKIPAPPKVPKDVEMPPPSRPASQENQHALPPSSGPFKKVLGAQNVPRAPAPETKNSSFRPFTMNLPPKNPKAAKTVPKALDIHMGRNKFATGSNSAPLGKAIDLSARLARVNDSGRIPGRDPNWDSPKTSGRSSTLTSGPAPPPPPPPPEPEIITKPMPIYHRVSMVGEGTYGKVYKASNNLTKELVALKRIRMENEKDGFPITAVREMRLLQALKHQNIVSLLEMMVEKSKAESPIFEEAAR